MFEFFHDNAEGNLTKSIPVRVINARSLLDSYTCLHGLSFGDSIAHKGDHTAMKITVIFG
jgi:hypothetical protein